MISLSPHLTQRSYAWSAWKGTAAVKALSDWVVTSGNAEEIIRRVPEDFEILFVPDRHLGSYLEEVTGRKMILWPGAPASRGESARA